MRADARSAAGSAARPGGVAPIAVKGPLRRVLPMLAVLASLRTAARGSGRALDDSPPLSPRGSPRSPKKGFGVQPDFQKGEREARAAMDETDPQEAAAIAGAKAEDRGLPLRANPYRQTPALRSAWAGGWRLSRQDRTRDRLT